MRQEINLEIRPVSQIMYIPTEVEMFTRKLTKVGNNAMGIVGNRWKTGQEPELIQGGIVEIITGLQQGIPQWETDHQPSQVTITTTLTVRARTGAGELPAPATTTITTVHIRHHREEVTEEEPEVVAVVSEAEVEEDKKILYAERSDFSLTFLVFNNYFLAATIFSKWGIGSKIPPEVL